MVAQIRIHRGLAGPDYAALRSIKARLTAAWDENGVDFIAAGANTLTANGGPTVVSGPSGRLNTAMGLARASSQYYSHADSAALSLDGTSFFVECWVMVTSSGAGVYHGIFRKENDAGNVTELEVNVGQNGGGINAYVHNGTTQVALLGTTNLALNNWYHYLCCLDLSAGTWSGYLNGVLFGASAFAGAVPATTEVFQIGHIHTGVNSYLNGRIAEPKLGKFVPTPREIRALYNRGQPISLKQV